MAQVGYLQQWAKQQPDALVDDRQLISDRVMPRRPRGYDHDSRSAQGHPAL